MTAVKEPQRPTSQHRPSFSGASSSLPRQSYSRASASFGSFNPAHRITRRKSSNLSPAAITAAVHAVEIDEDGSKSMNRRSIPSRVALGSMNSGSYPSPPNSLPQTGMLSRSSNATSGSAIVDGPPLSTISEKLATKNRIRRSSDGSTLSSKKKSGHGDLKCETCGKGYKHSSCLTKHLWEHTPEWTITSKLLISKHQQVQLLEAASVLVAMNQDGPEGAKSSDSEQSSASPAASGSSDREDEISSAETTPPPQGESIHRHRKHDSNASSAFSRSYQSVFSTSEGPAASSSDFQHRRQWSTSSNRPATANTSIAESYPGEDQADLAAAVGLLSCSYGTPQTGPVSMPSDIPPVPPLPARYQQSVLHSKDVDMEEASSSEEEDQRREKSHRYSKQDDDEGVFGTMEE